MQQKQTQNDQSINEKVSKTNEKRYITKEQMDEQQRYSDRVLAWNLENERLSGHAKKCCVVTFGCQQNEADSERIAGMAEAMGYAPTNDVADADLIMINTCAVREHAELRALSITGQYKHLKAQKPELFIGICGCMVSQTRRRDDIKMRYPYVNFSFGTSMLYRFPEILCNTIQQHRRLFYLDENDFNIAEDMPIRRADPYRAWVSIMYGCNNFCSYCVVPYVRGRERSRDSACILSEIQGLVQDGYREITLLGQNVNSYGCDRPGEMDFPALLTAVCAIPGDFIVRFMTSHPKDATQRLFDVIAAEPKIARHFHLPLQSGADAVLKKMNRRYTAAQYEALVAQLRQRMPDIVITSDMIVGFPGESETDFEQTLALMRRVQFDMVYSFVYSPRPGTPAAKMEQLDEETKGQRCRKLLDVETEIALEKNQAYVGTEQRVLVEGISKNDSKMYTGRTGGNKPVHFSATNKDIGTFCRVKIERAEPFALIGTLIR